MTAIEIGKYILMGVLFALISYLWLVTLFVQGPKGA